MARPRNNPPCTIVIKLGTSSIVHEKTHQPLLSTLSSIVETVVHLRRTYGHKVVLVSSGAIGVGLKTMNIENRPRNLAGKQALAAIGQGRLIALWDNLFGQLEQPIAQILLTRGDISDRTRYLNAVNTLKELLSMGVVPIVNENDTVSVSEIKFGDNDTLSAITSSMIHADYLFLLTDVDGLYTTNPRKDPTAKMIEVVNSVSEIRGQVSTKTLGSSLGTGGMETKLIAADIATAAGVSTIITSSKNPENILQIMEYHNVRQRSSPPSPSSSTVFISSTLSQRPPRPSHTMFLPSPTPMRDMKSWTAHTLHPSGSVVIDAGAHAVLSRRESGGRLLPAGVKSVLGTFASGQAVRILVSVGPAMNGDGGARIRQSIRVRDDDSDGDATVGPDESGPNSSRGSTRPATPELIPAASVTSSIMSLEPLTAHAMSREETVTLMATTATVAIESLLPDDPNDSGSENASFTTNSLSAVASALEHLAEQEYVEVGRGLANYNSAQIMRVKGLNSSQISNALSYADSEYVVENITIKNPPSSLSSPTIFAVKSATSATTQSSS